RQVGDIQAPLEPKRLIERRIARRRSRKLSPDATLGGCTQPPRLRRLALESLPLRREPGRPMRVLGGGSFTLPARPVRFEETTSFLITPGLSLIVGGSNWSFRSSVSFGPGIRLLLQSRDRGPGAPGLDVPGP